MPFPESLFDDFDDHEADLLGARDPEVEALDDDAPELADLPVLRELMGWLRAEGRAA